MWLGVVIAGAMLSGSLGAFTRVLQTLWIERRAGRPARVGGMPSRRQVLETAGGWAYVGTLCGLFMGMGWPKLGLCFFGACICLSVVEVVLWSELGRGRFDTPVDRE